MPAAITLRVGAEFISLPPIGRGPSELPPALIQVGSDDILYDDAGEWPTNPGQVHLAATAGVARVRQCEKLAVAPEGVNWRDLATRQSRRSHQPLIYSWLLEQGSNLQALRHH